IFASSNGFDTITIARVAAVHSLRASSTPVFRSLKFRYLNALSSTAEPGPRRQTSFRSLPSNPITAARSSANRLRAHTHLGQSKPRSPALGYLQFSAQRSRRLDIAGGGPCSGLLPRLKETS